MTPLIRTMARTAVIALFLGTSLLAQAPAEAKPAPGQMPQAKVAPPPSTKATGGHSRGSKLKTKQVNINSAGMKELKALPGINDALAKNIIQNRPYLSKGFLVTKNVIPRSVYESIKTRIVAGPPSVKVK